MVRVRKVGNNLCDYIFYLARKSEVNQKHLRERLLQSSDITENMVCSLASIKQMLYRRFDSIDFEQAKTDVEPFIRDTSVLDVWSADFFKQITDKSGVSSKKGCASQKKTPIDRKRRENL